jgi:hypothetical protein
MQTTLSATDYAARFDAQRERAEALARTGRLDDASLRRLADLRAVAAFRLRPCPADPVAHVRAGYAFMRPYLTRLADHDPSRPARIGNEDGYVYTFRPRTVLRRVLDHALDHLNQLEQWLAWRADDAAPTPTDGWASSEAVLDEDSLPLSAADLAAWLWRIDIAWQLLAERAAGLSAAELTWSPPGNEWDLRRVLHHVAGGFYVVWLDEGLPEAAGERFGHASRRLSAQLRQATAQPLPPDETYFAQDAVPASLDDILRDVLAAERTQLVDADLAPV